jgi:hypothetical protein
MITNDFKIFLKKEQTGFTMVSNKIITDNRVSSKAKFYYVYLSSKPDNWQFHINIILQEIKESRDAFYSGVKELESIGYLTRQQIKGGDNKFAHTEYCLRISPYTENTDTEKPYTENTDYNNTYKNNNDINKNDINKNDIIKDRKEKNFKKLSLEEILDNDLRFTEEDKEQIKIFLQDRRERKKPITERGLSILLNELKDLANRDYKMKYCIDRAIQSNWTGIKSEWFKDSAKSCTIGQNNANKVVSYNFDCKSDLDSIVEDNF